MNILVVSPSLPYPPNSGGAVRLYNIYHRLSRYHSITWLGPVWETQEQNVAGTEEFCKEVIRLSQSEQRPFPSKGLAGLLIRIVSRMHWERLFVYCYGYVNAPGLYWLPSTPQRMDMVAQTILQNKFDLVINEFEGNAELLPPDLKIPSVLATHNVASSIFKRIRATYPGTWEDQLFTWPEMLKIIQYERVNYSRFSAAIAVSVEDQKMLRRRCPNLPVKLIPNGVDIEYFCPGTGMPDPNRLVYLGNYNYPPNADAVVYFCSQILPILHAKNQNIRLTLVGNNPPAEVVGMPGVDPVGLVDDVRPYVQDAGVFIVPLRVGGGTRLKILEGLAMGKAVISTTIGAEGIGVSHKKDIILADQPEDFAQNILHLMANPDLRDELGRNGRALVEREYDWNVLADRARDFFEQLVSDFQRKDSHGSMH